MAELAIVAPSQPLHTSQAALTLQERTAQGIADGFVGISVGVENFEDLRDDLQRGLAAVD